MKREPKMTGFRARAKEYWRHFKRYFKQWWRWEPHLIVGELDDPYLRRWWLIPRNPGCNVYLHQFLRDDDDRALHGHPWYSLSILIWGSYTEIQSMDPTAHNYFTSRTYSAPAIIPRGCPYPHRIELHGPNKNERRPAWTIFITGPWLRPWGFYCPKGWVPWEEFILGDGTNVNRAGGCPE